MAIYLQLADQMLKQGKYKRPFAQCVSLTFYDLPQSF